MEDSQGQGKRQQKLQSQLTWQRWSSCGSKVLWEKVTLQQTIWWLKRWEHEGVTNTSNSNLVISSLKRFLMVQISSLSFPMNVAQKHEQVRLKRAQMHHSRVCDISHQ